MTDSSHSLIDTNDTFKYQWKIWQLFGLEAPKNRKFRLPYYIFVVFLNITITIMFPLTLIINCFFTDNLKDLCENLYITTTDVICNIKFLNVFFVRNKLVKVKEILLKLDSRVNQTDEIEIINKSKRLAHKCFVTFFWMFFCAIITSQLVVYVSNERIIMYPAWFPIDWKSSYKNFMIVHSYQLYGLIGQAIQDLANDTYPPAYLCILFGHINALGLRIKKLGLTLNATKEENYQELISCIKDHSVTIELFNTIQEIISTTCLAQFVCTGLAQCTIGIYLLYVGIDYSKMMNIFIFFAAITLEILVLCYFGDRLKQSSEELCVSIYSCNWINQNVKFRKALIILLMRSQKINVIKAGNLIPVCLPTFVHVMKTAYSVFAVLNKVKM